jgi:hypothetical protein
MITGFQFKKIGFALGLSLAILCTISPPLGYAAQSGQRRVTKMKAKKQELPPLPSGPTGPVQPMPLDAIAAIPPQVSFENNQLTIVAQNSTLADILRAVRKSTGAEIDVPAAPERVVTHLGPGPARDVVADLLNGSRFNYVLLGAPGDDTALTRVVLVAKGAPESITPSAAPPVPQPGMAQVNSAPPQTPEMAPPDANDQSAGDESGNAADDNADQQPPPESAEQPNPDQPQVKTPQQMLQEMQQRQMQLQNQQEPGQPVPGAGMPPHPPQEK